MFLSFSHKKDNILIKYENMVLFESEKDNYHSFIYTHIFQKVEPLIWNEQNFEMKDKTNHFREDFQVNVSIKQGKDHFFFVKQSMDHLLMLWMDLIIDSFI